MLSLFDWFRARSTDGRTATEIYGSIVAQARRPAFYQGFAIPDTPEMRYELLVLHMVLVLERLRSKNDPQAGGPLARGLVEAFVRDLDGSIREMAIGDTKVPRQVRKAAGGLYDRNTLYAQTLSHDGDPALAELIGELFFAGKPGTEGAKLALYVREARNALGDWPAGPTANPHRATAPPFPDPADFLSPEGL